MAKKINYGILASIDWNSNRWKNYPTDDDLLNSSYDYVLQNNHTFTYLNFAVDEVPGLKEDQYEAFIPFFWPEPPSIENRKYVNVIFVKSKNYLDNKTYIIGLYAFPEFIKQRKNINFNGRTEVIAVNIAAKKADILLLDNFVDITNSELINKILPKGKKAGKMNFNYLTSTNVKNILDLLRKQNPDMMELKLINGIKGRLLKSLPNL